MAFWRDTRHRTEVEADDRYAQARAVKGVTDAASIEKNADKIEAYRVGLVEGRKMSLLGKMAHLTESATEFHKETEAVLDGISEKIALGKRKRDEAAAKHHGYYDTIIAGVDASTEVIDRLSNGPLHEDGEG